MMKGKETSYLWHGIAIAVVIIWAMTFAITKTLLNLGLTPQQIMCIRFLIAWLCILPFAHGRLFANNLKDELMLVALGISGGSLYFWCENTALALSTTSNVALIVEVCPLLTALLVCFLFHHERFTRHLAIGSVTALIGVMLIVMGGQVLHLNPLGDLLAFGAALCWAIYGVIIKPLSAHYGNRLVTRKVFAYGFITMILLMLLTGDLTKDSLASCMNMVFHSPIAMACLLGLSIVASLLCFLFWNIALQKLGTVRTTNYIYLQPVITLAISVFILHEPITVWSLIGTVLILSGLRIAS